MPIPKARPSLIPLIATLAVFAFLASSALARPPAWRILRTPQFTVMTQLGEGATRTWAEEFCRFTDEIKNVLPVPPAKLPPLTVVIFASENGFRPYRPLRPNGKQAEIAGYFASFDTWSISGMFYHPNDQDLRETVFHEGVHWYCRGFVAELPAWLGEGLAEVFSTFEYKRGQVLWGRAIQRHVGLLQIEIMPLENLLRVSRDDATFNSDKQLGLFYAESWLLVHYLLFGKQENSRQALSGFLQAQASGVPQKQAFEEAFGKDYAAIERELCNYVRHGTYFMVKRAPTAVLPPMEISLATELEIESNLARLALGSDRLETARPHIDRVLALAPENPVGYELSAFLAYDEADQRAKKRTQAAGQAASLPVLDVVNVRPNLEDEPDLSAADRAVALGSEDAWVHLMKGRHLFNQCMAQGGVPHKDARAIANCYKRAIRYAPFLKSAYRQLASIVGQLDRLDNTDLDFLRVGRTMFPDDPYIALGFAAGLLKSDRNDEAVAWLETLLADDAAILDARTRPYAQHLLDQCLMTRIDARVDALTREGRYRDALAEIDKLVAHLSPGAARMQLEPLRAYTEQRAQLEEARAARQDGRIDDARKTLKDLLALPRLPNDIRKNARYELDQIEAAAGSEDGTR